METTVQGSHADPGGAPGREVTNKELKTMFGEVTARHFPEMTKITRFQIKNCTDSQTGLKKNLCLVHYDQKIESRRQSFSLHGNFQIAVECIAITLTVNSTPARRQWCILRVLRKNKLGFLQFSIPLNYLSRKIKIFSDKELSLTWGYLLKVLQMHVPQ